MTADRRQLTWEKKADADRWHETSRGWGYPPPLTSLARDQQKEGGIPLHWRPRWGQLGFSHISLSKHTSTHTQCCTKPTHLPRIPVHTKTKCWALRSPGPGTRPACKIRMFWNTTFLTFFENQQKCLGMIFRVRVIMQINQLSIKSKKFNFFLVNIYSLISLISFSVSVVSCHNCC